MEPLNLVLHHVLYPSHGSAETLYLGSNLAACSGSITPADTGTSQIFPDFRKLKVNWTAGRGGGGRVPPPGSKGSKIGRERAMYIP